MAKHIILIHGRSYKPNAVSLKRNWVGALAYGIERDHGKRALNKFKKARKTMAYYGDLTNTFLGKHTGKRWTKKREADDILLIAHSLGSIVSYDVLWKFSHYGEYQHIRNKGINTLATIGSPLGDEIVKDELKGSNAKFRRRYPQNIGCWINFAAEDDYIAHDPTLANDFKRMVQFGLTSSITDKHIYNMAIRWDNSNPHHGTGYLIHPQMSRITTDWLNMA